MQGIVDVNGLKPTMADHWQPPWQRESRVCGRINSPREREGEGRERVFLEVQGVTEREGAKSRGRDDQIQGKM